MNVHHHKMNSQRPTNTMQGQSNFMQTGGAASSGGGGPSKAQPAQMKKILQHS